MTGSAPLPRITSIKVSESYPLSASIVCKEAFYQCLRLTVLRGLTYCQSNANRVAQSVNCRMNFCCQTTLQFANYLIMLRCFLGLRADGLGLYCHRPSDTQSLYLLITPRRFVPIYPCGSSGYIAHKPDANGQTLREGFSSVSPHGQFREQLQEMYGYPLR